MTFVATVLHAHGVMLASAKGPVPNVADTIAGERIRGSWWGHADGKRIFEALRALEESEDVLTCRIVQGKRSFVHRRLWPALVRCAARFPADRLASTRDEHTAQGRHARVDIPFPDWVPADVLREAGALSEDEARRALGDWMP
jgi:hypothetical protein